MAKTQEEMAATAEASHSDSSSTEPRLLNFEQTRNYGSTENQNGRPGRPGSRSPVSHSACNSGSPYVYEEFDSKLRSITCPTCSGTGKLTKGECLKPYFLPFPFGASSLQSPLSLNTRSTA